MDQAATSDDRRDRLSEATIRSTRPLRILRLITRLNVGGPARHVATLTNRLDPARFESLLVAGTPGRDEGDMLTLSPEMDAGLRNRLEIVPSLGRDPNPLGDVIALKRLRRLIAEFRPDILDTHLAKAGTLGRLAALGLEVPASIHTFHGTAFEGHFPTAVGKAMAAWERALARRTDLLIAVSDSVAADLRRRGFPESRIRTVPLGLDLARFAAVKALETPAPRIVTLVARLVPVKDIPLFIAAVELVHRKIPDLRARIVGDGPLRSSLQRSAPTWIEWLGHRNDLPHLLTTSSVVALTSRSEGSPVALIEALAAGRPVVAVPVGGVVDVLGGRPGAILTADRSAEAVANALIEALEQQRFAREADAARDDVIAAFGLAALISSMERIYAELGQKRLDRAGGKRLRRRGRGGTGSDGPMRRPDTTR